MTRRRLPHRSVVDGSTPVAASFEEDSSIRRRSRFCGRTTILRAVGSTDGRPLADRHRVPGASAAIAQATGSSVRDVQAWVLGGHTEATMVPLTSNAMVGGVPLASILPADQIDGLVQRARNGGAEIVALLKTGSAFYAPSAATIAMVEAVVLDEKRVMPCAAYLTGEFGIRDAYVGVMARLGAGGIEQILTPTLSAAEQTGMENAANAVRELVGLIQ